MALLFAAACKRGDDLGPERSDINNIYGKWNWVQSSGGIAGTTITPKSEGYVGTLEITNDNTFSTYHNSILQFHDSFTLSKDTSKNTNYAGFVTFKTNGTTNLVKRATRDTLIIGDDFADGFTALYVRKKN